MGPGLPPTLQSKPPAADRLCTGTFRPHFATSATRVGRYGPGVSPQFPEPGGHRRLGRLPQPPCAPRGGRSTTNLCVPGVAAGASLSLGCAPPEGTPLPSLRSETGTAPEPRRREAKATQLLSRSSTCLGSRPPEALRGWEPPSSTADPLRTWLGAPAAARLSSPPAAILGARSFHRVGQILFVPSVRPRAPRLVGGPRDPSTPGCSW